MDGVICMKEGMQCNFTCRIAPSELVIGLFDGTSILQAGVGDLISVIPGPLSFIISDGREETQGLKRSVVCYII